MLLILVDVFVGVWLRILKRLTFDWLFAAESEMDWLDELCS